MAEQTVHYIIEVGPELRNCLWAIGSIPGWYFVAKWIYQLCGGSHIIATGDKIDD